MFDAYRGDCCLKWGQMEKMCDGSFIYPSKGGTAIKLTKPTIIVMSNLPPEKVYNSDLQAYIQARFNVTELK